MKRIVSILLVVVMMISVFSITASADSYDEFPEVEYKYYDRVKDDSTYGNYIPYFYGYNELHHYANETDEEPDWVLIACIVDLFPWECKQGVWVRDRLLWSMGGVGPIHFMSGYAVYLPESDEFISLTEENVEKVVEKCPGFIETLEKYGIGQLRGDINEDNKIDVLDATYIQRVLAGKIDYTIAAEVFSDGQFKPDSPCDFDCDGEITILDATKIQRHIAGLE